MSGAITRDPWAAFEEVTPASRTEGPRERPPAPADPWAQFDAIDTAPPPKGMLDTAINVGQQVARGATFNYGDELASGVGATLGPVAGMGGSWQERYDRLLAENRGRQKEFETAHPYVALGAQVAGAMANPVTRLSAGTSFLGRVGSNALINGLLGGVTGFGAGEGGFINRLGPAATGAATGAVLGAAVPAAVEVVGKVARAVAPSLGVNVAGTDAKRKLIEALTNGGKSVDDVTNDLRGAGNQPMALVDVGGEDVLGMAQHVARKPGPAMVAAKEFVDQRGGLNQSARLTDEVKRAINAQDFAATKQDLLQTRATAAAPLYENAFTTVIPKAAEAERVVRFIKDPIGQEALQKGLRVIELEHLAAGTPFDPKMYGVVREGTPRPAGPSVPSAVPGMPSFSSGPRADALAGAPTPAGAKPSNKWVLEPDRVPNMRLMDAVKRGYDEIVEGFRNDYGKLQLDQYGRAVNNARAVYTGTLREMYPGYADALNAWAGPSKGLDAMNLGARVLAGDADETAQAIAKLSPSEKDMFRIGVARAIKDKIEQTGDTHDISALNKIWGTQAVRQRVQAAFDDPAEFERFADFMKREMTMAKTNATVDPRGGSITAKVLMRDAEPPPVGPIMQAARGAMRGDPMAMAAALMPKAAGQPSLSAETAAELAPYLFSLKPGDRARLVDNLLKFKTRSDRVQRIADPVANALMRGGTVGTVGAVQLEN